MSAPEEYRLLAEALEAAAEERGKLAKIERLAGALRGLSGARLAIAARLLAGSPFAEWEQQVTSAGWATLARAASAVTGWDLETIGSCAGAIGDLGEAISLLLEPAWLGRSGLTILEVDQTLRAACDVAQGGRKAGGDRGTAPALLARSKRSISSRRSREDCAPARTS